MSQAALTGEGMSTGYLSRLESGARRPTRRAVDYLAKRLGVDPSALEEPVRQSFLYALTIAASEDGGSSSERLSELLESSGGEDPVLRWHGYWLVAQLRNQQGRHAEARKLLEVAVGLADDLDVPELRCRARTHLARCMRSLGDFGSALRVAEEAYAMCGGADFPPEEVVSALLALISCEAESGQLPGARLHSEELLELAGPMSDRLGVEARWTAATVRVRAGDHAGARVLLDEAMKLLSSADDLLLWCRLRLAATSLAMQSQPPQLERAAELLEEVAVPLAMVGPRSSRQELMVLQAHLAYEQGRLAEARKSLDELAGEELLITHRDQLRLRLLAARLLVDEGELERGTGQMRAVAEEAQATDNIEVAAEGWRLLADVLSGVRGRPAE